MGSILLINAAGRETRVALVESGHIAEFYLERKRDKGLVGNIYKGKVVRVLPGMQAAFVDIGEEKAAFLYVNDVVYDPDFAKSQFELTEGEHDEEVPDAPDLQEAEAAEALALTAPPESEASEDQPADDEPPAALADANGETAISATESPGLSERTIPEPEIAPGEPSPNAALEQAPTAAIETSATPAIAPSTAEPFLPAADPASAAANPAPPAIAAPAESSNAPVEHRGERRAPRDRFRNRFRRGRNDRDREREEFKPRRSAKIEDVLKVGQEVVVQVSKDPIGTKGARLTSHISIPGRHLVFMPTVDHIGISRRIANEKERRRLRETVERLRPPGTGFIVRTVADGVLQEKLESDIRFLIGVWNEVVRGNEKAKQPGLLHPDLDLILRATRDLFATDVEKLVVDDRDEYERTLNFVMAQDPSLKERIVLHDNEEPIFEAYGIEQELRRASQRKVWLKSGGYLIIDQAEALTAIDVNSGRYVGKKSLEETITKINVEAAKEIVYQLRLRNIGGIIICDFIDMEKQQNRERVFKTLQEALGRDKAKTNVLRISELGLVEMTRKRVRESVTRVLNEDCYYCEGKGYVKTAITVCYEIFREIRRDSASFREPTLIVNCSPEVAKILQNEERDELRHLMDRYNKSIQVRPQPNYHREQYDIYARAAQAEGRVPRIAGTHEAIHPPGGGESPAVSAAETLGAQGKT